MELRGHDISMVRGDNETIEINFESDSDQEISGMVELTVRKSWKYPDRIIHKQAIISDSKAVFDILPEDTNNMTARDYVYDVQWTTPGGIVTTVIKAAYFTISEEVTY